MGNRVAVLHQGRLQQCATPRELYDNPVNQFVAGFIGSPARNLLDVPITDGGVLIGDYLLPISRDVLARAGGDKTVTVGIRPEAFTVAGDGLPVRVVVVEELGADAFLYGTAEHDDSGTQIIARIDARMPHEKGSVLHLAAKPDQVHVFSTSTEERLSH